MDKLTNRKMYETYLKYGEIYAVEDKSVENLDIMWNEDPEELADLNTMPISSDMKQLVENLNVENLSDEEKIYIALKVGMLM
ncbi:MAG TPA: hypothetical protein C5S50_08315 [Methanosarcinaceae archaeon]|nr:hypothetical protein [Methanosarcinaceae archaeon]